MKTTVKANVVFARPVSVATVKALKARPVSLNVADTLDGEKLRQVGRVSGAGGWSERDDTGVMTMERAVLTLELTEAVPDGEELCVWLGTHGGWQRVVPVPGT